MTKGSIPIQKLAPPKNPVNIDISYGGDGVIVAEYECREAAIYNQYNWTQWQTISWWERAKSIAQYRLHHLIEAHVHHEANKPKKNTGGGQPRSARPRRR